MTTIESRCKVSDALLFIAESIWPEVKAEDKTETALHHWYALRFAASWYRTSKHALPGSEAEEMGRALDFVHRYAHQLTRKGDSWQATPSPERCDCPMAKKLMELTGFLILADLGDDAQHVAA